MNPPIHCSHGQGGAPRERERCQECHGEGRKPNRFGLMRSCKSCGGEGSLPVLPQTTDDLLPAPSKPEARLSSWLKPGERACAGCGGTGRRGQYLCLACRGFGSAPPDPYSLLAPRGSICTSCGHPGTDDDPVLDDPGGLVHRSHAQEGEVLYIEALRAMEAGQEKP